MTGIVYGHPPYHPLGSVITLADAAARAAIKRVNAAMQAGQKPDERDADLVGRLSTQASSVLDSDPSDAREALKGQLRG